MAVTGGGKPLSFKYDALNRWGQKVSGVIVARTAGEAERRLVRDLALSQVRLVAPNEPAAAAPPAARPEAPPPAPKRKARRSRAKGGEQVTQVLRSLSVMAEAGVSLRLGLTLLARTSPDPALGEALHEVVRALDSGTPLHRALGQQPAWFGSQVVHMVQVGEQSGRLHRVLEALADWMERRDRLVAYLKRALTYPMFLFGVSMLLVILVPSVLLDSVFHLLRDMHADVPLSTRVLWWFTGVSCSPWTYLAAAVALALVWRGYRRLMRREELRMLRDQALLRLWCVGPVLREYYAAFFAMALETLYSSGVPILTALDYAGASSNLVVSRAARRAAEATQAGLPLHRSLADAELLPRVYPHLLAAYEEAGSVATGLKQIARMAEEQVEVRMNVALAMLEPAILCAMGLLVGVIVIATLGPMLQVVETMAL